MTLLKGKPQSHLEAGDSLQLPAMENQVPGVRTPGINVPVIEVWAEANREELVTLCEVPLLEGTWSWGLLCRSRWMYCVRGILGDMAVGPASKTLLGLCMRSTVHCGG